ncbi:MAG: alpha/beta hydrolase [Magnetococcales bacterium]|nr:alpha/beta hydrolase [Magnetococcales bacterium]
MESSKGSIILVHGLWMPTLVMKWMARKLRQRGWSTRNHHYSTTRSTVAENADLLALFIRDQKLEGASIVAHSLGGVISVEMMRRHPDLNVGNLVALGSPFMGSWTAHRLLRWPFGRRWMGKSFPGGLDGSVQRTVPEGRSVGVIAGSMGVGISRLFLPGLPRPSDGTVSVAETVIPGRADHVCVKTVHMGFLISSTVVDLSDHFLKKGRFPQYHRGYDPELPRSCEFSRSDVTYG